MSHPTSRWMTETGGTRGPAYARRFRELAATGADLDGEARFLDRLLDLRSDVLDAGCGTGRVALSLARSGHHVVGVDVDASMVDEARADATQRGVDVRFEVGDLLEVEQLAPGPFDLVAAPGNVMVYLAPGTEQDVVAGLARVLRPGGLLVAGFAADRHVSRDDYDGWCAAAGLSPVDRFATWDGDPDDGGEYVVVVHRR